MKERIGALVGGAVEGMPWLGTFHSIGVKILRRHAELVGLKSGFTILDTDDQIRLIKQVIEAEGLDKDRWPARQLAALIDGWKNRGLTPDKVPRRRGLRLRRGQGRAALRRLPEAPEGAERRRLRRPPARERCACSSRTPTCSPTTSAASATSWSTSTRTPTSPSTCGCGCSPRARPTSAASATTTSRSTAGAAPRSTTSCASRRTSPAPRVIRLERNYRSTGHILAAASGLIAAQQGPPRQDAVHRRRAGRQGDRHRRLGRRGGGAHHRRRHRGAAARPASRLERDRHPGARLVPDARLRRPLRHASGCPTASSAARASTSARRSRTPSPISRSTANPANDLKFERIVNVPKRGLGDTVGEARPRAGPRPRRSRCIQAAREIVETEELPGKARKSLADLVARFERWRGQIGAHEAHRARRADPRRVRLHADVAGGQEPAGAVAAREPEGAGALHARVRDARRLPRARQPRHGRRPGRRRRARHR